MAQFIYSTQIGNILIEETNESISKIELLKDPILPHIPLQESSLIKKAYYELKEYFDKTRTSFTFALNPQGTDFQKKVWKQLCKIAYGETISYQEIAIAIGSPNAARAVGLANHHNPILIVIPCHRVIGKNGKLVGYGGGLDIKEKLLNLEKKECS